MTIKHLIKLWQEEIEFIEENMDSYKKDIERLQATIDALKDYQNIVSRVR